MSIPVSVIVTAKNEERALPACLKALTAFDEVIVVDSVSSDRTAEIAREMGASVVLFNWNGQYPKKRQWCLDNLATVSPWIFFVDADEIVTPRQVEEIAHLDFTCAGYFVKGRYIWKAQPLNHGLKNNKLALIDRRKFEFPVIDDLDLPGMGEMEGHYQPVLKFSYKNEKLGQLKVELDHHAAQNDKQWLSRHQRYAAWEQGMNVRKAWPADPVKWRQNAKTLFRAIPARSLIAFLHCYVWKGGYKDGAAGLDFARKRAVYYKMISSCSQPSRSISSQKSF